MAPLRGELFVSSGEVFRFRTSGCAKGSRGEVDAWTLWSAEVVLCQSDVDANDGRVVDCRENAKRVAEKS
jgi:hypothetical protein